MHFTVAETFEVLEALKVWAEEVEELGSSRPGWHMHVADADGNELTIAVGEGEDSDTTAP